MVNLNLSNMHYYNCRIYFTDATPDNIVVNESTLRLTIVDLDSLLIVDSHRIPNSIVNRHEQIDCEHCFAFIPDELCSYQLSDINLFSVCQVRWFLPFLLYQVILCFKTIATEK